MLLQYIASGIIIAFGINLLLPSLWEQLVVKAGLQSRSMKGLAKSQQHKGVVGDILLGAALGPVFSSCSPTYALIVAAVLPQSFGLGLLYLSVYAIGLSLMLLLIAYIGGSFVRSLGWLTRPNGMFSRVIGVLFIITGLLILFGADKYVQSYVLDKGWYAPIERLDKSLMR